MSTMAAGWLITTGILLGLGALLMLVAAIGLVRFPDFYTRMHPAGKGDTLGQGLVMAGLMCATLGMGESWLVWMKLLLIIVFIFVANPTATHAVARAAWITGVKPWERDGDPAPAGTAGDAPSGEPVT